ncbi:hypothetical protein D1007_24904 [Hordeum vulgare]|nr:hypothetical protein D1007_24904 [Hordeum vulgare]
MGNKWEKARKNKKEERYKLMLDAQKERMNSNEMRAERRLRIERKKIELEKQEAAIKWELQKAKTFEETELEKERLQLAHGAEDVKIMLADKSVLDEHAKR